MNLHDFDFFGIRVVGMAEVSFVRSRIDLLCIQERMEAWEFNDTKVLDIENWSDAMTKYLTSKKILGLIKKINQEGKARIIKMTLRIW